MIRPKFAMTASEFAMWLHAIDASAVIIRKMDSGQGYQLWYVVDDSQGALARFEVHTLARGLEFKLLWAKEVL